MTANNKRPSAEDIEFEHMARRIKNRGAIVKVTYKDGRRTATEYTGNGAAVMSVSNTDHVEHDHYAHLLPVSPQTVGARIMAGTYRHAAQGSSIANIQAITRIEEDGDYHYKDGDSDQFIELMHWIMPKLGWGFIGACCLLVFMSFTGGSLFG